MRNEAKGSNIPEQPTVPPMPKRRTCKKCLHFKACENMRNDIISLFDTCYNHKHKYEDYERGQYCEHFADRSKFIEVPNVDIEKINQLLTEALEKLKNAIDRVQKNISQTTVENALKEAILKATKEEAEQALREREKE